MALIEINKNPSQNELRWFGVMFLAFFGVIGAIAAWRFDALSTAIFLWSAATIITVLYYAISPIRKPLFIGWMLAAYPIGLTMSFIIMAITYYLVLTPIGILTRLFGVKSFDRGTRPEATSYWIPHKPVSDRKRYFQQF